MRRVNDAQGIWQYNNIKMNLGVVYHESFIFVGCNVNQDAIGLMYLISPSKMFI